MTRALKTGTPHVVTRASARLISPERALDLQVLLGVAKKKSFHLKNCLAPSTTHQVHTQTDLTTHNVYTEWGKTTTLEDGKPQGKPHTGSHVRATDLGLG